MGIILVIPAVLCFLALGAHFLRSGNIVVTAICAGMAVLVLVPWRWVLRVGQVVLVLACVEWIFTAYDLVQVRSSEGREWRRGAGILLGVAALNIIAAVLFQTPSVKARCVPRCEHPE